ncbi:MAG: Leucine-rich repeat-containing protein 40, variant 2 [Marteilia pararefringens]
MKRIPNIKDLYLANNELSRVPKDLDQLTQVENIDLHSNRINSVDLDCFPPNFNGHIDLSNNLIHSLEDARRVKRSAVVPLAWRSIDLSNNRLNSIPQHFFDSISRSVHHLDISNNLFRHLPESLGNMVHLKSLYLHNNEIENSDCILHNLTCLEQLTIGNTSAYSISEQRRKGAKYCKTFAAPTLKLNRLRFLKKLFLHNIENFDSSIEFEGEANGKSKSKVQEQFVVKKEDNKSCQFNSSGRKRLCILRELNIEGFQDTNNDFLVDLLSSCPNIEQLDISNVPRLAKYLMRYESISRIYLPFLKIFKSNDNNIGEISGHIFMYLNKLSRLDLRNNNLETLPEEIQTVKQLEHLDLSRNNLAKCPEVLWMTNLKYLDLSSNKRDNFIEIFQIIQKNSNFC